MQVPGRCYTVGGAVRDALLGLPASDRDWVVVGSSPEAMLAAGFRPVGKDFPVFLHPQTQEEYALARTERKSAPGYHGFSFHAAPDVTLEQDLARRDLTINAMAQAEDGSLIDPFGGQRDLRAGVLRHVSDAFAEDPVRLLRLARLAARFHGFSIAPETQALLVHLVQSGEVDALVPERVWQELSRGLMETRPSRMLEVLHACGALGRLLPGVDAGAHRLRVLDRCAAVAAPLPVRFACLAQRLSAAAAAHSLSEHLKVPTDCRELADVMAREHSAVSGSAGLDGEGTMQLLERCDALRRPERFAQLLLACECDAQARAPAGSEVLYPPRQRLAKVLLQVAAVDTAAVAAAASVQGLAGPAVGAAIRRARCAVIAEAGHNA
jgi:tRNA nucleotidyltransferase (CCA-adding enzyme)